MTTQFFTDGFPSSAIEAINFSYFLTENEKQEWREWVKTATPEQLNELVDILHSMWIDSQKNNPQTTQPTYQNNQQQPNPVNNNQFQLNNTIPTQQNLQQTIPDFNQANSNLNTNYNKEPINNTFNNNISSNQNPFNNQQSAIPFENNLNVQSNIGFANQNIQQPFNSNTQTFLNQQQSIPVNNNQFQPNNTIPTQQNLQQPFNQINQPPIYSNNNQNTPTTNSNINSNIQTLPNENIINNSQNNSSSLFEPKENTNTNFISNNDNVGSPVIFNDIKKVDENLIKEVNKENDIEKEINQIKEEDLIFDTNFKKADEIKEIPKNKIEIDEEELKDDDWDNFIKDDTPTVEDSFKRKESKEDKKINYNNLTKNTKYTKNPLLDDDYNEKKKQKKIKKYEEEEDIIDLEEEFDIVEKKDFQNKNSFKTEEKPKVNEQISDKNEFKYKDSKNNKKPEYEKQKFVEFSKIKSDKNDKLLIEKLYQEYLQSIDSNQKNLTTFLEKVTDVLSKYEEISDYLQQNTQRMLDINSKLVNQAKEIEKLKQITSTSGNTSIQEQIDNTTYDLSNLQKEYRNFKTETRRKIDKINETLAGMNADTYNDNGISQEVELIKIDINNLNKKIELQGAKLKENSNILEQKKENDFPVIQVKKIDLRNHI